jgi:hypothetical protein
VIVRSGLFRTVPTPVVSGTPQVGATLSARAGTWSPVATLSYRWYRNGAPIAGATSSRYRLTPADHARRLAVRVTGSRAGYLSSSRTSASTAVVAKPFTATAAPTISGTPRVGSTLTARVGAWTPTASISWVWKRDGFSIPGATRSAYQLVGADYGRVITVTAIGSRSAYVTKTRTSTGTARIAAPVPVLTRDGMYRVGSGIPSGTYVSTATATSCYWERRSDAGSDLDGIIANDFSEGRRIVRISSSDQYFHTDGCGSWTRLVALGTPRTSVGDGMHAVGIHVRPGLYKAPGSSSCYWARLSGFSGTLDDITENNFGSGQQYVWIEETDAGFETSNCGTWTRVSA